MMVQAVQAPEPCGQRLRVLHVITGLADGGAEAVLYRLCTADRLDQHAVVSLREAGKYAPLLQQAGVPVHCLNMPAGRLTLAGLRRLARVLRRYQPQVVQTWMYHANLVGGLAARWQHAPAMVWGIHHSSLDVSAWHTRAVARLCAWLSPRLPQRVVVCAARSAELHAALGYDRQRLRVIPNGYDIGRFRPDPEQRRTLRRAWGVDDAAPVIGCVARWDPYKDHSNLCAALSRLMHTDPAAHLVLVGTGMDAGNQALLDLLARSGLPQQRVQLLGRRTDIPAIMSALDVHVLSSLAEAFPNVLAEAMACGTPCVTTDVGDAALIVGDTGWVVPPRDPAALATAIHAALAARQDRDAWARRQAAARERIVTHFSLERMVAAYRAVWLEALQCPAS